MIVRYKFNIECNIRSYKIVFLEINESVEANESLFI
jgi:hypothetical protein